MNVGNENCNLKYGGQRRVYWKGELSIIFEVDQGLVIGISGEISLQAEETASGKDYVDEVGIKNIEGIRRREEASSWITHILL